jgi:hypothetical protein
VVAGLGGFRQKHSDHVDQWRVRFVQRRIGSHQFKPDPVAATRARRKLMSGDQCHFMRNAVQRMESFIDAAAFDLHTGMKARFATFGLAKSRPLRFLVFVNRASNHRDLQLEAEFPKLF